MIHPVQQGISVAAIGAVHESKEIEPPALRFGVATTPDIQNEEGAKHFTGRSALKKLIELVWIKFVFAVEPTANLDGETGKTPDKGKDHLVGRGFSFGGGNNGCHGQIAFGSGPDLHGQALG
jgi:hypothetical protein